MDGQSDMSNAQLLDELRAYADEHTKTVADRVAQDMADTLTSRREITDAALMDAVRANDAQSGDTDAGTDTPQVVALSTEQWEVVSGALRVQDTCFVFQLVLSCVLVGCLLWRVFADGRGI